MLEYRTASMMVESTPETNSKIEQGIREIRNFISDLRPDSPKIIAFSDFLAQKQAERRICLAIMELEHNSHFDGNLLQAESNLRRAEIAAELIAESIRTHQIQVPGYDEETGKIVQLWKGCRTQASEQEAINFFTEAFAKRDLLL